MVCVDCGSELSEIAELCDTCGKPADKPNVRLANRPSEVVVLTQRYANALADAARRGVQDAAQLFDRAMSRTVAVVNVDIYFLRDFLSRDNLLYATYHQGVGAGVRKAAELGNDRERTGVDGILFGQMFTQIVTAALSLECRGLISYGHYTMQLRDVAVAKRASVLEENSYFFVRRHGLQPNSAIPPGYSSDWPSRHKLACAKLLSRVGGSTTDSDFQNILLKSNGDRQLDEYIEVHLYKGFDNRAIDKVSGPSNTGDAVEVAMWAVVKNLLSNAGKVVEEY